MTIEQLQHKIEKLEETLVADDRKRIRLGIIRHELDVLRQDLLKSNKKLAKEKRDVEELEKKNLKSLFTEILGDKEEQLEKERQEFLQVVLHHNSLIDEIQALEYERKILQNKLLKDRDKLESELENTLTSKSTIFMKDASFQSRMVDYDSRLQVMSRKTKDVYEALREGKILQSNMNVVKDNLKKVKEWGRYKMKGRGRYSSYGKRNYIDKANRKAVIVNVYIKKFSKELVDVFPQMDINLSIDYYEDFLKQFYNNLITDWVIQRKLDNAIHGITIMIDKLNRIQMLLEKESELITKQKNKLTQIRKDFIKAYK